MGSKLWPAMSVTALVVALLGSTPLGEAARGKTVAFAKRAGFATNAAKVGGIRASRTPRAGHLVPLTPRAICR